ncbi:MAG TPA: ATP-binding protein [Aggregatilineales bacterium]|nr:response regulator [Anaerolineales bacterium]HRE47684.1 ATP-binding protein [Aggregatilineales bacterium]
MSGERILLIDHQENARHITKTILQGVGYDLITAATGEEGALLARDLVPELIITEISLPGQDGFTLIETLREQGYDTPVIVCSVTDRVDALQHALRIGVADYLVKPYTPAELLDSVRRVMNRYWSRQIADRLPAHLMEANKRLEKRFREMAHLLNVGASVTAMLDLNQVLDRATEAAINVTAAEAGGLFLMDRRTDELYLRAVKGIDQRTAATLRIKINQSGIGRVALDGEPLVISERNSSLVFTPYPLKSAAYVPLRLHGKVIGILGVEHREEAREFDAGDVQTLSIIADFAAIAIENTRLHAETTRERDALDAILRDTDDVIIVVDKEDHVLFCNPTAREIFNVGSLNFIGKPITEVITNPEVITLFQKDPNDKRGRRAEITLGAAEKTLNAQLTILEGIGRAVVMQDITPLKRLDKAKTDFVASVAHDLRSPLTAVLGYAELIQRAGTLNSQQEKFIEQIVIGVQSITLLITELLELSKLESDYNIDLEPVALANIIDMALKPLQGTIRVKGLQTDIQIALDSPPVWGNALRLRQMCANLIGNAVKYTPNGGRITIHVWGDNDLAFIQVQDSGIGISPEDQPYVFDKFFRTDRAVQEFEGTGLGLSIVKTVVDQHDGRIWLESKENEGTTFTVIFPAYQAPKIAEANS